MNKKNVTKKNKKQICKRTKINYVIKYAKISETILTSYCCNLGMLILQKCDRSFNRK